MITGTVEDSNRIRLWLMRGYVVLVGCFCLTFLRVINSPSAINPDSYAAPARLLLSLLFGVCALLGLFSFWSTSIGFGFCASLVFAALGGIELSELLHGMFARGSTDSDPFLIAVDQWMPSLTGVCLVASALAYRPVTRVRPKYRLDILCATFAALAGFLIETSAHEIPAVAFASFARKADRAGNSEYVILIASVAAFAFLTRKQPNGYTAGTTGYLLLVPFLSAIGHRIAPDLDADLRIVLHALALAAVPFGFCIDGIAALRRHRDTESVRDPSRRDALTALFNRRALDHMGPKFLQDCRRLDKPFSVLMMDIDKFKSVNDRYGHPAGDAVLTQFAALAGGSVRSTDFLARYGGEEFVVVMPGAALASAMRLAEAIREKMGHAVFTHAGIELHLTLSIGAATTYPGDSITFESLLESADKNLYRAKREGRNRVCAPLLADQH